MVRDHLDVAFQDRVASVMGRDQRFGSTVILSSGFVHGPRRAEKADLNSRRTGSN